MQDHEFQHYCFRQSRHVTTIVSGPTQEADAYKAYGPWFIFENGSLAISDPIYNRPRPDDDAVPQVVGAEWGLPVFGMDLIHTGGNHISNGLGTSISTGG